MTWTYCPECGGEKLHHQEGNHKQCAVCHQEWFSDIDYSETVRGNLEKSKGDLFRLQSEVDALKGEMRANPDDYPNLLRINREQTTHVENLNTTLVNQQIRLVGLIRALIVASEVDVGDCNIDSAGPDLCAVAEDAIKAVNVLVSDKYALEDQIKGLQELMVGLEARPAISAEALHSVLTALCCSIPHRIRELQAWRGLPDNPIDQLQREFNAWIESTRSGAES